MLPVSPNRWNRDDQNRLPGSSASPFTSIPTAVSGPCSVFRYVATRRSRSCVLRYSMVSVLGVLMTGSSLTWARRFPYRVSGPDLTDDALSRGGASRLDRRSAPPHVYSLPPIQTRSSPHPRNPHSPAP